MLTMSPRLPSDVIEFARMHVPDIEAADDQDVGDGPQFGDGPHRWGSRLLTWAFAHEAAKGRPMDNVWQALHAGNLSVRAMLIGLGEGFVYPEAPFQTDRYIAAGKLTSELVPDEGTVLALTGVTKEGHRASMQFRADPPPGHLTFRPARVGIYDRTPLGDPLLSLHTIGRVPRLVDIAEAIRCGPGNFEEGQAIETVLVFDDVDTLVQDRISRTPGLFVQVDVTPAHL